MLFYILNIETVRKGSLNIYGHMMHTVFKNNTNSINKSSKGRYKIFLTNLFSPILFPIDPKIKNSDEIENQKINLENEIIKIFGETITKKFKISVVQKTNYFYENIPTKCKFLRLEILSDFLEKEEFKAFLNENNMKYLLEFNDPIEQFMTLRNLKGPCLVEISNFRVIDKETIIMNDFNNFKFVENINFFKNLRIGAISITSGNNKETNNKSEEIDITLTVREYGFTSSAKYKFKDFKNLNKIILIEKLDFLAHHNLKEKDLVRINKHGLLLVDTYLYSIAYLNNRFNSLDEMLGYNSCEKILDIKLPENEESDFLEIEIDETDFLEFTDKIFEVLKKHKILELAKEMSEVSYCLLKTTFTSRKLKMTENLLLRELYKRDYLIPEYKYRSQKDNNMDFSGGLVFDPIKGIHENITLLLDFNSLYPSILTNFNVCFSTIKKLSDDKIIDTKKLNKEISVDANSKISKEDIVNYELDEIKQIIEQNVSLHKIPKSGILPTILKNLIEKRKAIKLEMKNNANDADFLDIKQRAVKLASNSIYGCLGAKFSRFYSPAMAEFVTAVGRDLLLKTKKIVEEKFNLKIIYGDTDSIIVDSNLKNSPQNYIKSKELAFEISKFVNSENKNLVEIECEKIFKKFIIFKKKKYGAIFYENSKEIQKESVLEKILRIKNIKFEKIQRKIEFGVEKKGLETDRRDHCALTNNMLDDFFNLMLLDFDDEYNRKLVGLLLKKEVGKKFPMSDNPFLCDILYILLEIYSEKIKSLPNKYFYLTKILSKNLDEYANFETIPHVFYAKRLADLEIFPEKGDVLVYYIKDCREKELMKKMAHPSEEGTVDITYYLNNQITSPLGRISEFLLSFDIKNIKKFFPEINLKYSEEVTTKFALKIKTPCCNSMQRAAKSCFKCSKIITDEFLTFYFCVMFKQMEELFCSKEISTKDGNLDFEDFEKKNEEFDNFLDLFSNEAQKLEIKELIEFSNEAKSKSGFRIIDFTEYFSQETFL